MANKNLELEHQYRLYLERCGLDESKLHPIQKTETKRAFFGGVGQILVLMRDDIASIEDEDRAVLTLEDLIVQVEQFWKNEIKKNDR